MFYQCPKCKKTWQYPIEKCPDCFFGLKRMAVGKIKVIGISKVNLSTLFHPKVPYFVLLLEDDQGNKWAQKSVKEYKIGDEFKIEVSTDKNSVSIWRIKYDILEGLERVVELLGGLDVKPETKILILPTLVSPKHPYFAENTSPQFLDNLIKFLFQKGLKGENIKVAAQSFDETPIEASAQKSQLLQVCLDNKINPLDLSKTNFIKKEGFEISTAAFNNDLIINLPILKLDPILKVRGATENVLKFLKKESYLSLKYLSNQEEIMQKIQKVLPGYLTIAEAINIQKSDQYLTFLGLVLASFNSLHLDRVFAQICQIQELPEYLKNVNIDDIPVVGRNIKELQYDVERF